MKKLQFSLQIITLVLAFPVWFIAELTHTGKAMQNSSPNNADSASVEKVAAQANEPAYQPAATVTMPDTVELLVNN